MTDVQLVLLGASVGVVSALVSQVVKYFLDHFRDKYRWRREEADRTAGRDLQEKLETRRLRQSYRQSRVSAVLDTLDALLGYSSHLQVLDDPNLGPAAKNAINKDSPGAIERLQESMSDIAHKLIQISPMIGDQQAQSKLNRCFIVFSVPEEMRKDILIGFHQTAKEIVDDCYQAIEDWVLSEL